MKVTRDYLRKVIQETLELEASKKPTPATSRTVESYKTKIKGALRNAIVEAGDAISALSQSSYKNAGIESHLEELKQLKQKIQSVYEEIYGKVQQPKDPYEDSNFVGQKIFDPRG